MENKAKAYLAECYALLDKLPDDHKKGGWGLFAMALCNVNAALTSPDLIKHNLDFQADVTHRSIALIEKLRKDGTEYDWSQA